MPLSHPPTPGEVRRLQLTIIDLMAELDYMYAAQAHAVNTGGECVQLWSQMEEEEQAPWRAAAQQRFCQYDFED